MEGHDVLSRISRVRESIADDCKGFYLCYQPIVYAKDERLKGAETLIRWRSEEFGTVPPNLFIPVLEGDSTYHMLGNWIVRQAMTDTKKILEKYPDFLMNVNLSYSQMNSPGFIEMLYESLKATGCPPEHICLELTERCRLIDMGQLRNLIEAMRDMGFRVALDDFGTGYSSLTLVNSIQLDTIKIDREFVKDIEESEAQRSFVKRITELLSTMADNVCIEGIESAKMRELLLESPVNSLQGYYYSRPVELPEFMEYAAHNLEMVG